MVENIECKQLCQTDLSTVEQIHALFPHWKRASVQRKIKDTVRHRDKRFVALQDGRIVAHVRVVFGRGLHKHRVEVTSLVVEARKRRHHIATELMKFILKELPKERKLVLLAVDSKNDAAIELYKKLGFEQYGLLKKAAFLDGKLVDNCLMRKER